MTMRRGVRLFAGMLGVLACSLGGRQSWPSKNVTIVVPWPRPARRTSWPGRQPRLNEMFGKTFLIDNRGGAGGDIGSEYAARSPADGHTLLITSGGPIVINPHVYKDDLRSRRRS